MTNSDLIYLFIDGETTEIERDILFKELANNNELQIEFQDALKLNKATHSSDFAITPPIALTGAIFSKAGFNQIVQTAAIVGGATATGGILKELFATLNTKFAIGVISAVMASVASFTLLSTFNVMNNSDKVVSNSNSNLNNSIILQDSTNYNKNILSKNIPITKSENSELKSENTNSFKNELGKLTLNQIKSLDYVKDLESNYQIAIKNIGTYKNNLSSLKNKIVNLLDENQNFNNEIAELKANGKAKEDEEHLEEQHLEEQNLEEQNLESQKLDNQQLNYEKKDYQNIFKIYETNRLNSLESNTNYENVKIYNEDNNPKTNLINKNVQNANLPNLITKLLLVETNDPSLLLEYRGITGLEYFPQRIIEKENTALANNIAISALVKYDENIYYGLSGGQEDFPIYILNQNQPNFRNSLIWGAANLRYYPEIFKFNNFTPYIETSIGGTQLGPMSKNYLGISWEPIKDVNLNIASEGSLMSYRNNGSWKLSGKLGLTYGISLKF